MIASLLKEGNAWVIMPRRCILICPRQTFRSGLLDTQSAEYFFVCILYIAQVSSESVLVQLLMGILIPETACIRRNLVSQNNLAVIAAELNLEINQVNVQSAKIFLQHFVYFKRIFSDIVNFLLGGKSQCQRVIACLLYTSPSPRDA